MSLNCSSFRITQCCLGDCFYNAADCTSITLHMRFWHLLQIKWHIWVMLIWHSQVHTGVKTDKRGFLIYHRELLWQLLSGFSIPLTDQMKKELYITEIQP